MCQKKFHKILLIAFSFPFWAHCVCVFQTDLTTCQSFLFYSLTFNLFQTFSVRELKCNWRGGSGKKKKRGFLWSRVTANRDKLLAAEFEGALLEIWSSIVDCVLSLPKNINYPLLTLWAMQTQTNGRLLLSWLWNLLSYSSQIYIKVFINS